MKPLLQGFQGSSPMADMVFFFIRQFSECPVEPVRHKERIVTESPAAARRFDNSSFTTPFRMEQCRIVDTKDDRADETGGTQLKRDSLQFLQQPGIIRRSVTL